MPPTVKARTVSVIGLGAMGTALARAFLASNLRVTVWNRTSSRCEPLRSAGATVVQSVSAAAEASDVVLVCVLDYKTSDSLLHTTEVTRGLRGKVLVQLSTGTPREARAADTWARDNGIVYLDGAIMGYPKDIGGKECTILYSGPGEAFESLKDVLLSLGGNPIFVGEDIGNASTLDSSILSFFYGSMLAFFHGAAICESEGFSIQEYTSTLISLLPVVGDTMKTSADMITKGNYEGSQASLSIHTAAAGHILHLSQESGIDSAYPQLLRSYFERALAAGHDAHELAALFEEIRKPRGGA